MTIFVPPDSVGTLYMAASLLQGIGVLVSGPLLTLTFRWGMSFGGFWLGMPYLLTFLHQFVVLMAICNLHWLTRRI